MDTFRLISSHSMSPFQHDAVATVDFVAWQRELGQTAYHLACIDRDYGLADVFNAVNETRDAGPFVRKNIADSVNLPSIDLLDAPPQRDGATQVYVLGEIDIDLDDGSVLATDFDQSNREYAFIGAKTDNTLDIAPVNTRSVE